MAEYDPSYDGAWDGVEGYKTATDVDHGNFQGSSKPEQPDYSVDPTSHAHGDNPPLKASPKPAAKKPRTAGGFLVGESDSDSEDCTPVSDSVSGASSAPAPSPLKNSSSALPVPAASSAAPPVHRVNAQASDPTSGAASSSGALFEVRTDRTSLLEQRVRDDPRGATNEWLALIAHHQASGDLEEARKTYDRFFAVFPQAAEIWISYLELELGMNNFSQAEAIFARCLKQTLNVPLWTKYLDYIRRRNDLSLSDTAGNARAIVAQVFNFCIDNIGQDKDSCKIWADYIQFLKSGPGRVGGSDWQDQQKMDQLRKAYQRATAVPIENVNQLWKDYDQFEMNLNKMTGRKYLAERSSSYMTAKSAYTALKNVTNGLQRVTLARLPPAPGFEGDQEFAEQVELWKNWIAFEKSDPLEVKNEQPVLLQQRILYTYKQALMALRFYSEMWADAAQWCFENGIMQEGHPQALTFLAEGIEANPENVLLALKHGDYIESTLPVGEDDESKDARARAVREPYQKVLDTLYGLISDVKARETATIKRIEEAATQDASNGVEGEDDEDESADRAVREKMLREQIKAIKQGNLAQTQLLSRTLSHVWIALGRATRRIQGKGKSVSPPVDGMRKIFADARAKGRLTSDVYIAMAQMEWTIYKDAAGGRIFERGAKLFPEDENFALEYIKYLHSRDDFTNARVLFETVVNRLTQKPELAHKAKLLYAYFHKFESQFGDLAQISKLEARMSELFSEDPKLAHFNARFSTGPFDPIAARIIVSPTTQLRPKQLMHSIERTSLGHSPRPAPAGLQSPRPPYVQIPATNSPKRPYQGDDLEEANPPRKMLRAEQGDFTRGASPSTTLKGAAGRRMLDRERRMQGGAYNAPPANISRDISFLLGLMPPAHAYNSTRFNARALTRVLGETNVPDIQLGIRGGAQNRQISTEFASSYTLSPRPTPAVLPAPNYSYGGVAPPPHDPGAAWKYYGTKPPMPPPGFPPPPKYY